MNVSWFSSRWFGASASAAPPPFDASDVLFWRFKPGAPGNQSAQLSQSSQWVKVLISAQTAAGVPLSPSEIEAMGVQIAFVQSGEPAGSDWRDMRVGDTVEGGIYTPAFARVGPSGSPGSGVIALAPGVYQRWVRVKATPYVVEKLTPLAVEGAN